MSTNRPPNAPKQTPPHPRPVQPPPPKRVAAIAAAGHILALAAQDLGERTPRESALAAHWSGGPSIDELERRIAARFTSAA